MDINEVLTVLKKADRFYESTCRITGGYYNPLDHDSLKRLIVSIEAEVVQVIEDECPGRGELSKLTKEQAFAYTIQQWEWLAKNGSEHPESWPGWAEIQTRVSSQSYRDSPLCWYFYQEWREKWAQDSAPCSVCESCPLRCQDLRGEATIYMLWKQACTHTERRKYARLYLIELRAAAGIRNGE